MLDFSFGIFDGTLSSAGVPTGTAIGASGSQASTQVLDMLAARDLGADAILGLHVDITTTFTSTTSMSVALQGSPDNGSDYVTLLTSPVYPVADLIAGAPIFRYVWPLNQGLNWTAGVLAVPARYYRLYYTFVGDAGAGAVFSYANFQPDRKQFQPYTGNYTAATYAAQLA